MSQLEFSATGPQSTLQELRRRHAPPSASKVTLWIGIAAAAVIYATGHPGQFTISTEVQGPTTSARFIQVQGEVENPSITTVQLHVNGASQPVSVADRRFASMVPLTRGDNTISASVPGVAANLVPGSNLLRITAQIPASAIWSALTWDGPGDIDLHLVLPNGQHVFYGQKSVGDANLDFDNTARDGPEHIVMDSADAGKYQMQVVYYAANGPPRNVRWSLDLRLRDGQQRYHYSGELQRVGEVQTVSEFSFP